MSVKLVVFNNGLQVVGEFSKKDDKENVVFLKKPVQLVMLPNQNEQKPGQVGMAFAPFLQYTEEWESGISFIVTDILTVATPLRELMNSYSTTFGTGLVLPPGVQLGQ